MTRKRRSPTNLRPATLAEWAAVYDASPDATFFHGPRWSQLVSAYEQEVYRPEPMLVELGESPPAILGITTAPTRIPGIRRKLLSPYGCVGGWLTPGVLSRHSIDVLVSVVCRGEVTWRLGPQDETIPDAALGHWRDEVTHVIDLRDGADVARSRWRSSARRQVDRAERAQVTVRQALAPLDWDAYHRLYRRTLERWDTPLQAYDHRLFEIVPRVAGDEALLLLAERAGEIAAGAIVFVHGRHAGYWHGASDVREAPGSANALHWHALEILERRGVESYDLLGSGPLPGVVRFKESIGGKPQRVRAVERSGTATRLARVGRRLVTPRRASDGPSS